MAMAVVYIRTANTTKVNFKMVYSMVLEVLLNQRNLNTLGAFQKANVKDKARSNTLMVLLPKATGKQVREMDTAQWKLQMARFMRAIGRMINRMDKAK